MKTRTRARRAEDKEKRREAIIDAAEKVFARDGCEDANFGAVAKQSKLSRALIYVYFPTKDDLINAVCQRALRSLLARFERVVQAPGKGIDHGMAIARAYHEFSREEPLYFWILTEADKQPVEHEPNANEEAVYDCGKQVLAVVAQAMARGLRDGSIDSATGDPGLTAVGLWALTHGLIQISTSREIMLKDKMGVSSEQALEHGLKLIRMALAGRTRS